jgi:hypothetical protein
MENVQHAALPVPISVQRVAAIAASAQPVGDMFHCTNLEEAMISNINAVV